MWQISKSSLIYEIPCEKPTYIWEHDDKIYFTIVVHNDEAEENMINVLEDMESKYFTKGEKRGKS